MTANRCDNRHLISTKVTDTTSLEGAVQRLDNITRALKTIVTTWRHYSCTGISGSHLQPIEGENDLSRARENAATVTSAASKSDANWPNEHAYCNVPTVIHSSSAY